MMLTVGTRRSARQVAGAIVRGGLLVWMSSGFLCSQPTFEHVIAAPAYQYAVAVRHTHTSDYLVAGSDYDPTSNRHDGYLARLDPLGRELWAHPFGGATNTSFADVELAPGGFVVLGSRASEVTGRAAAWLASLDDAGDERWSRTVPAGDGRDFLFFDDFAPAAGGGWIAAGQSGIYAEYPANLVVARLDDAGEVVWSHELGPYSGAGEARIEPTGDGGWIVASPDSPDVVVRKLDAAGNETWSTAVHVAGTYVYPLSAQLTALAATTDGSAVVSWTASYTNSQFGIRTGETQLTKIDPATGQTVWSHVQPITAAADYFSSLRATNDGGLILAGDNHYVIGCGYGFSLCVVSVGLVARQDSSGAWLWRREIGTIDQQLHLLDAWETFDQGVVAVGDGYFSSDVGRRTDLYVARTDSAGDVAPPEP